MANNIVGMLVRAFIFLLTVLFVSHFTGLTFEQSGLSLIFISLIGIFGYMFFSVKAMARDSEKSQKDMEELRHKSSILLAKIEGDTLETKDMQYKAETLELLSQLKKTSENNSKE